MSAPTGIEPLSVSRTVRRKRPWSWPSRLMLMPLPATMVVSASSFSIVKVEVPVCVPKPHWLVALNFHSLLPEGVMSPQAKDSAKLLGTKSTPWQLFVSTSVHSAELLSRFQSVTLNGPPSTCLHSTDQVKVSPQPPSELSSDGGGEVWNSGPATI